MTGYPRSRRGSGLGKLLIAIAIAGSPVASRAQGDAERAVELVSREAQILCAPSSDSGRKLRVGGEIDAGMRGAILHRLLGADANFGGEVEFEEWTGVEQVLREHRLSENEGIRACVREILPILSDLQLRASRSTSVAPPSVPLTGECHPSSAVLKGRVLVEAGTCFTDGESRVARVQSVSRNVVVYFNASGAPTRCYPGDRCAFGFDDRIRFGFMDMDGKIYLVSKS